MTVQTVKLNNLYCAQTAKNVGRGNCAANPTRFVGTIAIPKGKTFTASDISTFQVTLQGLSVNDNATLRTYTMSRWVGVKKNTQAAQEYTIPYIGKVTLAPAVPIWGFQWLAGGICNYQNLLQFHGTQDNYDFLFIDNSNVIWGRWQYATDGITPLFGGYTMSDVAVDTFDLPDQSNPTLYYINFAMDNANQVREYIAYVPAGFDVIGATPGLQTVVISGVPKASSNGIYDVTAVLKCSSQDLFAIYGTALTATTAWSAINVNTNGVITISSVTATTTGWELTLSTADPDYPTVGLPIAISLVAPSVLKSAVSVTGIESPSPLIVAAT